MTTTQEQRQRAARALASVIEVIIEAIRDIGEMKRGLLYAAMAEHGCTLAQYEDIEAALIAANRIRRQGDILTLAQ